MDEFFTWSMLATFGGASVATAIITEFVKESLGKVPTQIVSYFIAFLIIGLATSATGGMTDWTSWAILPFNAVLVSLASNGAFSAIERAGQNDKKE